MYCTAAVQPVAHLAYFIYLLILVLYEKPVMVDTFTPVADRHVCLFSQIHIKKDFSEIESIMQHDYSQGRDHRKTEGAGKTWKREKRGGVRVLLTCMTKHDKLSQKIKNTAQIDILTTRKRSKIVAIRHVSKGYKNCGRGSTPDETPLEEPGAAPPDPLAEFQGKCSESVEYIGQLLCSVPNP